MEALLAEAKSKFEEREKAAARAQLARYEREQKEATIRRKEQAAKNILGGSMSPPKPKARGSPRSPRSSCVCAPPQESSRMARCAR